MCGHVIFLLIVAATTSRFVRSLYRKLVAEGWKNLLYLPKERMYADDFEGTIEGCHPNDWGMAQLARAFGRAVKEALGLQGMSFRKEECQ